MLRLHSNGRMSFKLSYVTCVKSYQRSFWFYIFCANTVLILKFQIFAFIILRSTNLSIISLYEIFIISIYFCCFRDFIIKFLSNDTIIQNTCISKSKMKTFRFEGKNKIWLLHNFPPFYIRAPSVSTVRHTHVTPPTLNYK